VLFLLLVIAGLLANNWMVAREQQKTQAALKNEKQRAAEARRALGLLVDVSEEELADAPLLQGARRRLLETALQYYQDFIETHSGDPQAQAELEAGKQRVRTILDELATLQGANLVVLAADADVHHDLKLGHEQRQQLVDLRDRSREQTMKHFREQRDLTPEARRQKFYELAKTQEESLSKILQADQLTRLRQIERQLQGPRAFHESQVVEALKLTTEQRRKIREFRGDALAAMFGGGFEPGPKKGPREKGGGPSDKGSPGELGKRPPFEEIQKAEVERIVAILTMDQQERWRAMTGTPYEGRFRIGPPSGGFGPGPPRGALGPR
jgi:hypothetical protein